MSPFSWLIYFKSSFFLAHLVVIKGKKKTFFIKNSYAYKQLRAVFWVGLLLPVYFKTPLLGTKGSFSAQKTAINNKRSDSFSIGHYTQGCLAGSVALPKLGPGFQVIRSSRNRYYAHPDMIRYLGGLGRDADALGLGVLWVGDLSGRFGGKIPKAHASHQVGLDADIWFRLGDHYVPQEFLQNPAVISVLTKNRTVDLGFFGAQQAFLLYLAAEHEQVARIFVNPAIKKELCKIPWNSRHWLAKIRPWDGHDAHFHVRLRCSLKDPWCVDQEPIPLDEGCTAIQEEKASYVSGESVGSLPPHYSEPSSLNKLSIKEVKNRCESIQKENMSFPKSQESSPILGRKLTPQEKKIQQTRKKKLFRVFDDLKQYYNRQAIKKID